MGDDSHSTDLGPTADMGGINWARAQVAAARVRGEALIATGQLPDPSADRSAALPIKDFHGYHLLREIHRGGQGVVYQALQQATNRKVAIKVLLEGAYASKSARQRFEREIELVASLRHPNVISVFHSDQTADGLRFCVMDYVRGVPLTQYVTQNKLVLADALRVFTQVCDAVNHAHQKGVIHRDLKPSNILVDVDGVPRVLDFGLAKLIGGPEQSLLSMSGQVVGTLPYMSPEQTRGNADEIDTRTDVYSLGVLLYEVLTGHYPYPVIGPMADVLRNIAESEPTPPSQYGWRGSVDQSSARRSWFRRRGRSSPGARQVGSSVVSTRSQRPSSIDDELQTIVMKALAKDRERRYQSAGELSRDIGHYLGGEPIEAKRDSALYVLGKQLRRHLWPVGIAGGFVVLIAVGLVVSLTLWRGASAARDAESSQRARAAAVSTFLTEMLTAADPAKAKGAKLTVREALDTTAKRIEEGAVKDQPLVEAEIRFTIGSTYFALGLYPEAEAQFRAADALQSRELGDEHPDTLRTRSKLAESLGLKTDYAGAARLAQPTMEAQRRVLGPDDPDTLQSMVVLGSALAFIGRFAEAESLLHSAIDGRRRVLGQNHAHTADAMDRLGRAYMHNTYPDKAEPLHREALRIHTQALGAEHPATLLSMNLLGSSLANQVRAEEAEAIYRRVLEPSLRVLGPEHIDTLNIQMNLAGSLNRDGRFADAETMYRESLAGSLRSLGPTHRNTITAKRFLAGCLVAQQHYPEAETLLREALDAACEKYGREHGDTSIRLMCALTDVLAKQRKDPEAEQVAREVLELQRRQLPRPSPGELHQSSSALIQVLNRRGAYEEALRVEQELIETWLAAAHEPDASSQMLDGASRRLLYPANEKLRDPTQALELALQANERSGQQNPRHLRTLARAYLLTGDSGRAKETLEHAVALSPDDPSRAAMLNGAASELLTVTPEALRNPGEALEFALRANELSDYRNASHVDTLALAYFRTGDTPKAIEFQKQALDLLPQDSSQRPEYESRLAEFEAAPEKAGDKDGTP